MTAKGIVGVEANEAHLMEVFAFRSGQLTVGVLVQYLVCTPYEAQSSSVLDGEVSQPPIFESRPPRRLVPDESGSFRGSPPNREYSMIDHNHVLCGKIQFRKYRSELRSSFLLSTRQTSRRKRPFPEIEFDTPSTGTEIRVPIEPARSTLARG